MNRPTLNKLALACACVAGTVLLSACGDSSTTTSSGGTVVTPVTPLDSKVRYQVMMVDGVTDDTITDDLSVTFTGDATLKDSLGSSLNGKTVTTTNGLVALGATFTSSAQSFSIQVGNRAKGWIETGTAVVAEASASGDKQIIIKLFNTNKVAALNSNSKLPVAMAVGEATTDSTGKIIADVALATTAKTVTNAEGDPESMGVSTLKLAAGTIGTTADGKPAVGKLTVAATTFSNANAKSMSAFPGGFAANVTKAPADVLGSASATSGAFVTGGFAQFNVTDSTGKAIKNFDKPVAVTIDLPKSSKKLDGTAFKVGDTYPVWSYDEASGTWTFEQSGKIQDKTPADPNYFEVAFETRHLSSWNLDLYGSTCTAQINLTGRSDARRLEVEIVGVSGQRFSRTVSLTDSQIDLYRMLTGTNVNVTVRDEGTVVGHKEGVALCQGSQAVPLSLPVTLPAVATGTVHVEVSESCANGTGKTALPTFTWLNRGQNWDSGYAKAATTSATVASYDYTTRAGTGTVWIENPRATDWYDRYSKKSVTITAGQTSTVSFSFTKTCPTGSTGSTGAGS